MRAYDAATLGVVANVDRSKPRGRAIPGFISYGYALELLRLDRIEEPLFFLCRTSITTTHRDARPRARLRGIGEGTGGRRAGAVKWKHAHGREGGGGMSGGVFSTAGKLFFTGDSGDLVPFDPATGKLLWRQRLTQSLGNGPSSWMLDGKQYLIVGAGDTLYALTLARTR
jgi:PQQ-like domain